MKATNICLEYSFRKLVVVPESCLAYSLTVDKCFDIETQRWADVCDILPVQLLQDGGLSGVIKTA